MRSVDPVVVVVVVVDDDDDGVTMICLPLKISEIHLVIDRVQLY